MKLSVFEAARVSPASTALVLEQQSLTYAELAEQVAARAAALHAAGSLNPGEPVALVARPTLESLCGLHALIAYAVPVLLLHAALPEAERRRLMTRARVRTLLLPDDAPLARTDTPAPAPPVAIDAEMPLALIPTSGTTGTPKIVVLSRRALAASARASAENLALTETDRWLLCLPLAHVGGLSIVTRSLLARSAVVAFATTEKGLLRSAPELAARLHDAAVSVVSLVPAVLDALLELQPPWTPAACLRVVLLGGAATPLPLLRRAQAQGVPVLTTFGLTETCSQVTTTPLGEQPRVRGVYVSAGRTLPGVELSLDGDRRVRVRGSVLCSGYLDEALTFQPDQWLVTDDRGELDSEGNLFLLGRITECIITGGENVDPQRVEAVLSNVPGVRAACVVGIDDARFGQLVACALVAEPTLTLPELMAHAATELARHELPRTFLQLDSLPRLSNGKTDRSRVKALFTASSADAETA